MARRKSGGPSGRTGAAARPIDARHTGRHIALLHEGSGRTGAEALRQAAGLRMAVSADFDGSVRQAHLAPGEGVLFERLGVALLHSDPDQAHALASHPASKVLLVEPERVVRAIGSGDAAGPAAGSAVETGRPAPAGAAAAVPLADTAEATWGLQATRACSSRYAGRGVRVAILDTGIDLRHPDFAGRTIVSQSFVTGVAVDDANGHGTHCAGIACGPAQPRQPPRYGVACGADLYVGKILGDDGGGSDGSMLAGIDWAVRNGCAIVSMSVGTPVDAGQPFSAIFEQVAVRALAAGILIIAAAGNDSERPDTIAPVDHPANCPSILAVAAVDPRFGIAPFSCGGLNATGGEVNIAAPGVAILSAWPAPSLQRLDSGTSAATPLVAGIAAMLAEAHPAARGRALQALLLQSASPLSVPARDVGAGLAQAPQ